MKPIVKEEHRENLKLLVKGIDDGIIQESTLDMKNYAKDGNLAVVATPDHPCKTLMCLIGHGPSCGVPLNEHEIDSVSISWHKYSIRAFCEDVSAWYFMFADSWPNDVKEARERIMMVIENRMPEYYSWTYSDRFADVG